MQVLADHESVPGAGDGSTTSAAAAAVAAAELVDTTKRRSRRQRQQRTIEMRVLRDQSLQFLKLQVRIEAQSKTGSRAQLVDGFPHLCTVARS